VLALEALPGAVENDRPYVPEVETQLVGAWRDLREQLILTGHGNDLRSAVFSPDGKRGPIWNDQ
jgi:hypothetical protein